MNAAQKNQWENIRNKGFWRYVLLYWVLLWGGTLSVVTSVFDYYFFGAQKFSVDVLMIKVLIFLIGGMIAGTTVWFYSERKYKKNSGDSLRLK